MSWVAGGQPWGISGTKYRRMTRDSKIEWYCRQTVSTLKFHLQNALGKGLGKQSYSEQMNPAEFSIILGSHAEQELESH